MVTLYLVSEGGSLTARDSTNYMYEDEERRKFYS